MGIKLPSVLSVQRGTIVSDGLMSSLFAGKESHEPIRVIRHGIRGISNKEDAAGPANIQRTESAKTDSQAIGLEVSFAFRTIHSRNLVFACGDEVYRRALEGFIGRFFQRDVPEFEEVCRRYARNILNGRWLWRNRILGDVSVDAFCEETKRTYVSPKELRLRDFLEYTEDEKRLAEDVIATGLVGGTAPVAKIKGRVLFGFTGEVEVFPSQNMVTSKPKGFARSLYKVDMIARKDLFRIMGTARNDGEDAGEFMADMIDMGRAALRDQKIGNAIRTIDTWYPDCDGTPIPVEPNGANLEKNVLYRKNKGTGAKDLLMRIDEIAPSDTFNPDAAYLIALLVRGGVFSEGEK
jgi:CRISPR-associated protein Csy3